jgi:hypothetical protein
MSMSEEAIQVAVPRSLGRPLRELARKNGVGVGEYIRRLIEADLARAAKGGPSPSFPFGDDAIRTGRQHGSVDHDR